MTVQAAAGPVPDGDHGAIEQQFTEIYQQYRTQLARYIWRRLDLWQGQLAEDLANEAFIELWQHLLKGRPVDKPYGLLCRMARTKLSYFWSLQKNKERLVDLGDPANAPVVATGHAYAADTPGLAVLSSQLDQAMERMADASEKWRSLHKEAHRHRKILGDDYRAGTGGVSAAWKERAEKDLGVAERRQALALKSFQDVCRRVGTLRAELESIGGANWKSSTGMPSSTGSSGGVKNGSVTADLDRTHCPEGHRLDLNNIHFDADGRRHCRACNDASAKRHQAKVRVTTPAKSGRAPARITSPEALAAARALLADPAMAGLSVVEIGGRVGLSSGVLYRRIPDLAELRRAAKEQADAPVGAAR